MKKIFIYFFIICIVSNIVMALPLFSPKLPPGIAGRYCNINGCTMEGPIYNATFYNATFATILYVNYTQVLNPPWLNISGGNMTGNIDMGGYNIYNIGTLYGFLSWAYLTNIPLILNGTNGINGTNGVNGIDGTNGINGINGLNGANGTTYNTVGPYLYNDSVAIYFNESYLNETISVLSNETDPFYNQDKNMIAFTNKSNIFEVDQYLKDGIYLYFKNSTKDTYFYYNITNSTLQLYVNGKIQQDWGNSTTVYGRATFLADAIFNNISGNYMLIDTNVIINGYVNAELYIGNGSGLTQVCLSNGTGCFINATFNVPIDWNNLYNIPPGLEKGTVGPYLYNDTTTIYLNESNLNNTIRRVTGIWEENVSVIVSGGTGNNVTIDCCNGNNEILQLAVFPTTGTNKYRFNAYTTIGNEIVDTNRELHTGNWTIAHSGSIVMTDTITFQLTNVQIDEPFRIRVRWQAG